MTNPKYKKMLSEHFDGINISQGLFWKWLEPEKGKYDEWNIQDTKDQLLAISSFQDDLVVTGMHIIFPQTYPDWLINGQFTPEELEVTLKERIRYLVSKYGGDISRWVVVNEPYFNGASIGMNYIRHDTLYEKLGRQYIRKAFEFARELSDPGTVLIYNDTANHSLNTSDWTNALYTNTTIENLKSAQGLVDIAGMQMHLDAAHPPNREDIIRTMQTYAQYTTMGVEVTELDVDMSKLPSDMSQADKQAKQAEIYRDVLSAALDSGVCVGLNVWYDTKNWKPAEVTLFDSSLDPKLNYYALLQELGQRLTAAQEVEG